MLDPIIIEQNKRIAIFMGGKLDTINDGIESDEPTEVILMPDKRAYRPAFLNYHTDWNKLMDVRNYIVGDLYGNDESLHQLLFTINNYNVTIVEMKLDYYGDLNPATEMIAIEYAIGFTYGIIEAMYTAILKFIDWYDDRTI